MWRPSRENTGVFCCALAYVSKVRAKHFPSCGISSGMPGGTTAWPLQEKKPGTVKLGFQTHKYGQVHSNNSVSKKPQMSRIKMRWLTAILRFISLETDCWTFNSANSDPVCPPEQLSRSTNASAGCSKPLISRLSTADRFRRLITL